MPDRGTGATPLPFAVHGWAGPMAEWQPADALPLQADGAGEARFATQAEADAWVQGWSAAHATVGTPHAARVVRSGVPVPTFADVADAWGPDDS